MPNKSTDEQRLTAADMMIDGKPFVGVFNERLRRFAHKDLYRWFLSIIIDYDHLLDEGMPDEDDTLKMQSFSDTVTEGLAVDRSRPNALFLGRVTGDGYTEIMWYVNNPDIADSYLKELIDSKEYPLEFDYRITPDPHWSEASYWLDSL